MLHKFNFPYQWFLLPTIRLQFHKSLSFFITNSHVHFSVTFYIWENWYWFVHVKTRKSSCHEKNTQRWGGKGSMLCNIANQQTPSTNTIGGKARLSNQNSKEQAPLNNNFKWKMSQLSSMSLAFKFKCIAFKNKTQLSVVSKNALSKPPTKSLI